jgi:uncharacterized membrane protein
MNGLLLGLIMFICAVPTFLIMYFMMYPRNWKNRKHIFGVNNRSEFKTEANEAYVDSIVKAHNKQATVLLIVLIAIATGLLFVPSVNIKMMAYVIFIYISLVVFNIPFALGNSELKKYKKVLGIVPEKVLYADLKAAGRVHALNRPAILAADFVGVIIAIVALLCDLKVIPLNLGIFAGSFVCTGTVLMFLLMSFIILPIALMVDNYRNEVISENSDINTNYNRAKKRNFANYMIMVSWINNVFAAVALGLFFFAKLELLIIILVSLYLLAIMGATAIFAKNSIALNKRYVIEEAKLTEDDDDYWILGMFYYNPNDKRLNVEKRVGVGGTINMAHPAGKVISGILVLLIVGSIVSLIFVGMMMSTPIRVIDTGDQIVCHQLWDEYKINKSDILMTHLGQTDKLSVFRSAGVGVDGLWKGNFVVNGESGCKVFMNPNAGKYIMISTADRTYYISADTAEATEKLYEGLPQPMAIPD